MTKVVVRNPFPVIDRDSFLTPFDKMFDQIVEASFPDVTKSVGVKPFQGTAYPKVNVYEYEDRIGIVAEIPGGLVTTFELGSSGAISTLMIIFILRLWSDIRG